MSNPMGFQVANTKTVRKVSPTKAKEQRIKMFLSNYAVPFDMEDAGIDLRTMAENYADGIIPSADVTAAVNAVVGAPPVPANSIDPRDAGITPKFAWIPNTMTAIDPRFQRDIAGNHVTKIELDFDSFKIIVPCAVKHPKTGLYLIWDGNHTRQVCERQGWSHLPVWYIDMEAVEGESEEDTIKRMVQLAGEAFLSINKKNKRAVSRYDEHLIRVETFEPVACAIDSIRTAANCTVKRNSEAPGAITHIAHLYDKYELTQATTGIKGIYLARALKFCRTTWPKEKICGITSYSIARLFALTETATGVLLPQAFDAEFGNILKAQYGPMELVGDGIKDEYEAHFGGLAGHPLVVTSGLILSYNKHNTQGFKLAQPEATFPVR
jgi:hypothetical protein